jgi:hypothetical protein
VPPALACKFTVSELAVLRIVGDEVRQHGRCDRTIAEIAARAGTCRAVVQNAIRTAAQLGLLTVEERRREGQRNRPNIVRIVSKEWLAWIAKRPRPRREGGGSIFLNPTDRTDKTEPSRMSKPVIAAGRQQAGSAVQYRKGQACG